MTGPRTTDDRIGPAGQGDAERPAAADGGADNAADGGASRGRMLARNLRGWPARRWLVALATAVGVYLVIAIPTDLIDTPLFTREIPPTWWSHPVLIATAVLSGLLVATYVALPERSRRRASTGRLGSAGAIVSFFAVGCPVCNKIGLLALGASGALTYFEPVQPVLAVASLGLLGWALWRRLTGENACPVRPRTLAADA